jgi:hypothetical protein
MVVVSIEIAGSRLERQLGSSEGCMLRAPELAAQDSDRCIDADIQTRHWLERHSHLGPRRDSDSSGWSGKAHLLRRWAGSHQKQARDPAVGCSMLRHHRR